MADVSGTTQVYGVVVGVGAVTRSFGGRGGGVSKLASTEERM